MASEIRISIMLPTDVRFTTSATTIREIISTNQKPSIIGKTFNLCSKTDNSQKAQCKHCFHFLMVGSNTTLRNHIEHPHCEAKKAQKNQNSEAGQTSMARDGSVFMNILAKDNNEMWSGDVEMVEAFYGFASEIQRIEKEMEKRNRDMSLKNRCGAGVLPYQLLAPSSEPGVTCRFEFEVEPLEDHTFEVEREENADQGAGLQEVQAQYLMDYQLARDRDQHLACKLFRYREDSNEAAFAVTVVEKIYPHESLTFNNTVACEVISQCKAGLKNDMDARSDVYVLSNGCRKSNDDSHDYYWEYAPAKGNILGLKIIKDQSGITLRVSQSRIHNEKLVQTLLKGHSTLSLEDSLLGDCDVEKNVHGGLSTTEAGYMTFTEAWKKEIWLKGLLTESGYELRLVACIATGALVKYCSRSEVPAQGVESYSLHIVVIHFKAESLVVSAHINMVTKKVCGVWMTVMDDDGYLASFKMLFNIDMFDISVNKILGFMKRVEPVLESCQELEESDLSPLYLAF
ncbi:zinc finger, CCHC-type containing protein [Tanacetum coccineum]